MKSSKALKVLLLSERENVFNEIARKISEAHSEFSLEEIELSLEKVKKTEIRRMIIKDKIRPDKRVRRSAAHFDRERFAPYGA